MVSPFLASLVSCIIGAIYKFLPAGIANMTPVFIKRWNILGLRRPIDGNKLFFDNRPVFGSHKTWQGLIFGTIAGGFTGLAEGMPFLLGALLGFGALLGDLIGSFIKRRLGYKSGENALLLDQLPFAIVAILITMPVINWKVCEILLVVISIPLLHRAANTIGYFLGLKEVPW